MTWNEKQFFTITERHEALTKNVWEKLGSWRPFVIGIDGHLGVGKSTLARFLAWQLGMSVIEFDNYLKPNPEPMLNLTYREDDLLQTINNRLNDDRPIIIESIFLRTVIRSLNIDLDYSIYVENNSPIVSSKWFQKSEEYIKTFDPKNNATWIFKV